MDLERSNTCYGCLNSDRKMKLIEDFWTKTCFSQIISEISIINPNGFSVWLCWECAALLTRFTRFKYQVLQSYKILQDSKTNLPYRLNAQRLQTQKIINIAILPNEDDQCSNKEEFTSVEFPKTENTGAELKVEDLSIKEEDSAFSNNEDNEDTCLSELVKRKKNQQLSGSRRELKKRKNKNVDIKSHIYTQIDLSDIQLLEDRKSMALREEYVNAMFRCDRCILSFPNIDDLKDHIKLKHDLNACNFKCAICECSFATEVSYNYHMNRHTRRYQCGVCAEMFTSKRSATKHYETMHCLGTADLDVEQTENNQQAQESTKQEPCFPCEFCSKTFRWKTSLRKHLETHHIERGQKRKPYCEPCKLTFTTTSNLQKHVKTSSKHQIQLKLRKLNESLVSDPVEPELVQAREEQVRTAVNGARAQHPCPHCGARYQWRGNLLRHLHTHTARARGELVCQPCNRTFSSIATYQQHMKISKKHVSENDFKYMCTDCGKKFANKTRLKDHVDWEHLKNYVHTCDTCQKVFKSHTSLYLHKQVVHKKDSAKHLCDHCGKPFPNQAKLRSHITALHSGEAPYRCGSCAARFSWHSCLSRHVRRVHRKRL